MTHHVNDPLSRIHYNCTYTPNSPRSICRVARCVVVYNNPLSLHLGKGRVKPAPLHPHPVGPLPVVAIGLRRFLSMPQTYWEA